MAMDSDDEDDDGDDDGDSDDDGDDDGDDDNDDDDDGDDDADDTAFRVRSSCRGAQEATSFTRKRNTTKLTISPVGRCIPM